MKIKSSLNPVSFLGLTTDRFALVNPWPEDREGHKPDEPRQCTKG
jgi:hypothetical protein